MFWVLSKILKALKLLKDVISQDDDDSDDSDIVFSDVDADDDSTLNLHGENDSEDEFEVIDDEEEEDEVDADLSDSLGSEEEVNGTTNKRGKTGTLLKKETANKATPKSANKEKKVFQCGVSIEDIVVGEGRIAKPGKIVQVYYEGRLKDCNKVFDSNLKGSGLEFRLVKPEVINAVEISQALITVAVVGMKVGGKRKIIFPPDMAYGKMGSPPAVPPNSTVVFEVELKNVY